MEDAPTKKEGIMKATAAAMKAGGAVKFSFQVPLAEGSTHYCHSCDKFRPESDYDGGMLSEKGPGERMCVSCEEYADMFG